MNNLFQFTDLIAILPQIILITGALLILFCQIVLPRGRVDAAVFISGVSAILALAISLFGLESSVLESIFGGAASSIKYPGFLDEITRLTKIYAFSGHTFWNPFASIYSFAILCCLTFVILMAPKILKELDLNLSEAYQMMLYVGAGLLFFISANDLMTIFISLELSSLPLFVLAAWDRKSKSSNEAGIKYFLLGVFSAAFFLLGTAFLYGATGTMNLLDISALVNENSKMTSETISMVIGGILLIMVGIGFKVAVFPFHAWVPDVYEGSITIVTALMGSLVKIGAVAVFFKIMLLVAKPFAQYLMPAVVIFSVLSMFYGNYTALLQENIKRMFAFSSIAHAGYMASMFYIPDTSKEGYMIHPETSAALFFYVFGYALTTVLVFGTIAYLEKDKPVTFESLKGLSKTNPISAFLLALSALSFAGIPPMIGFFGKFYILRVLLKSDQVFLALMVTINSLIGIYYYARVLFYTYWDFDKEEGTLKTKAFRSAGSWASGIILSLAVLILGFLSDPIFRQALSASYSFR
ncbi:MAG: NADH-quinone oxidoreductase subunit N [Spirochaetia bacterium]|nr:NADH-quinone oxidoreductase subunit N [Spirochaetia bacterium]